MRRVSCWSPREQEISIESGGRSAANAECHVYSRQNTELCPSALQNPPVSQPFLYLQLHSSLGTAFACSDPIFVLLLPSFCCAGSKNNNTDDESFVERRSRRYIDKYRPTIIVTHSHIIIQLTTTPTTRK